MEDKVEELDDDFEPKKLDDNSPVEDKFEELGCEFKNESECEEELEDEGLTLGKAEKSHYDGEEIENED